MTSAQHTVTVRPARITPSARDDAIARRRREQVGLELDAQHGRTGRHEAQRRVTACAIRGRCDNARVQKTVLLHQVVSRRDFDVDLARLDAHQSRAERRHEFLALEAGANARLELRILRYVWDRHVTPRLGGSRSKSAPTPKSTHQTPNPRAVKMPRAKNALAANARAAGHEVEATLTHVALRRHLGAREDAKRARHARSRSVERSRLSFVRVVVGRTLATVHATIDAQLL